MPWRLRPPRCVLWSHHPALVKKQRSWLGHLTRIHFHTAETSFNKRIELQKRFLLLSRLTEGAVKECRWCIFRFTNPHEAKWEAKWQVTSFYYSRGEWVINMVNRARKTSRHSKQWALDIIHHTAWWISMSYIYIYIYKHMYKPVLLFDLVPTRRPVGTC
jgi:hypothetical protein